MRSSLDAIFNPRSVAVVGASDQPASVGGAVFQNLRKSLGENVFAINRKHSFVQGRPAFRTVSDLTEVPDLLVICTPAPTVCELTREFGHLGGRGIVVISAGFREAGPAGQKCEAELRATLDEFPGLRLIGPNCLGILRPAIGLNASFSPVMPRGGGLTFLSQSGALVTGILDWSVEHDIGFSACVSMGNMVDVGMGDLVDYFAADESTDAVLLYIESLDDPRHFMAAARACTRRKPVLAYKSGRFAESSLAAASHTGAIASLDAVYDAAFRRAGVERVNSIEGLFDCARLLVGRSHAPGDRLAIVTNAGGPGVMACDAWLARQGRLAPLAPHTLDQLNAVLPPCWSHGNPVDVLGDASPERYRTAIDLVLRDPGVDAVLVILTPQTMTEPDRIAETVIQARATATRPIVASWIGGSVVEPGKRLLKQAAVPVYDFPEGAVDALAHLASSGRLRESAAIYLPAPAASQLPSVCADSNAVHTWRSRLAESPGLLGEIATKELFSTYGIPVVPTRVAHSADEAVVIADQLSYPVVMKVLSPEISHKTDVGGVRLNLATPDAVRLAYGEILASVSAHQPQAVIEGMAMQPMVSSARGVELLLGMKRDPAFGPVILIGAGGVTAELQKDSILDLPPMDDSRIDRMLHSLRLYPLLEGYRGRPGVNLPQLRDVMARFIQLVEDLPGIATVEINPLLVTATDVVALDARLLSNGQLSAGRPGSSHLAIRPYPVEWQRIARLRNGQEVSIRPVQPGDEAGWTTWIRRPESRAWLANSAHGWWADFLRFPERGCYLDYDRELVLVARNEWDDWCGVALLHLQDAGVRPSTDTRGSRETVAMFDAFVRPDMEDSGLGTNLWKIGVEIARQWLAVAMESHFRELANADVDWLCRQGFRPQPSTTGSRFRMTL